MVGRITKGASIRGVLEYNAGKVRNGEATVLYGNLVLGDCEQSDTFDMRRALLSFQPYLDTRKIKDPVFHVSLNPDITDCLTDAQLTEIAREYMERMGFGQQPYYVFKHRDIDREHIHIVSVRLRDDGSIISDSQDRPRSKAILQDIERRYGLRPAVKGQEQREFDTARRSELAVRLQQAILDDNAYVFCSFLEMNMISRSYVTGYTAHACDYYQVTADLDING